MNPFIFSDDDILKALGLDLGISTTTAAAPAPNVPAPIPVAPPVAPPQVDLSGKKRPVAAPQIEANKKIKTNTSSVTQNTPVVQNAPKPQPKPMVRPPVRPMAPVARPPQLQPLPPQMMMSGSFPYFPMNPMAFQAPSVTQTPSQPIVETKATADSSGEEIVAEPKEKDSGPDASKMDIDAILDVTAYAGIDMKHEEEQLADLMAFSSEGKEQRIKLQTFMNLQAMKKVVQDQIGSNMQVEDDYLSLVALATQEFCRRLMEKMIILSKHRTLLLHSHFLRQDKQLLAVDRLNGNEDDVIQVDVKVKDDIKSIIGMLEKSEREDEREYRRERARAMGVEEDELLDGPMEPVQGGQEISLGLKRTKKVEMPQDMRQKLVNQTALKAAGGAIKSWMIPGNTSGVKVVPRKAAEPKTEYDPVGYTRKGKQLKLNRPMTAKEIRRVILKDALFCLENEVKASPVSMEVLSKWWLNIK